MGVPEQALSVLFDFRSLLVFFEVAIGIAFIISYAIVYACFAVIFPYIKEALVSAMDAMFLLFKKKVWFHFFSS
jgi:hypothetical protein